LPDLLSGFGEGRDSDVIVCLCRKPCIRSCRAGTGARSLPSVYLTRELTLLYGFARHQCMDQKTDDVSASTRAPPDCLK